MNLGPGETCPMGPRGNGYRHDDKHLGLDRFPPSTNSIETCALPFSSCPDHAPYENTKFMRGLCQSYGKYNVF